MKDCKWTIEYNIYKKSLKNKFKKIQKVISFFKLNKNFLKEIKYF
jgi:hypothetical protein